MGENNFAYDKSYSNFHAVMSDIFDSRGLDYSDFKVNFLAKGMPLEEYGLAEDKSMTKANAVIKHMGHKSRVAINAIGTLYHYEGSERVKNVFDDLDREIQATVIKNQGPPTAEEVKEMAQDAATALDAAIEDIYKETKSIEKGMGKIAHLSASRYKFLEETVIGDMAPKYAKAYKTTDANGIKIAQKLVPESLDFIEDQMFRYSIVQTAATAHLSTPTIAVVEEPGKDDPRTIGGKLRNANLTVPVGSDKLGKPVPASFKPSSEDKVVEPEGR